MLVIFLSSEGYLLVRLPIFMLRVIFLKVGEGLELKRGFVVIFFLWGNMIGVVKKLSKKSISNFRDLKRVGLVECFQCLIGG